MKSKSIVTVMLLFLAVVFMTAVGFSTPICIDDDVGVEYTIADVLVPDLFVEFDAAWSAPLMFETVIISYDNVTEHIPLICTATAYEKASLLLNSELTNSEATANTILKYPRYGYGVPFVERGCL